MSLANTIHDSQFIYKQLKHITPAGISYQLNQLLTVGLVRYCTKETGRGKRYVINEQYLKEVFDSILDELA